MTRMIVTIFGSDGGDDGQSCNEGQEGTNHYCTECQRKDNSRWADETEDNKQVKGTRTQKKLRQENPCLWSSFISGWYSFHFIGQSWQNGTAAE